MCIRDRYQRRVRGRIILLGLIDTESTHQKMAEEMGMDIAKDVAVEGFKEGIGGLKAGVSYFVKKKDEKAERNAEEQKEYEKKCEKAAKLIVRVVEAKSLKGGSSDPYVTLRIGGISSPKSEWKTTTIKKTATPAWHAQFTLPTFSPKTDVLSAEIWDWNRVGSPTPLGAAHVSVAGVGTKPTDQWYKLENSPSGEIHLVLTYEAGNDGYVPGSSGSFVGSPALDRNSPAMGNPGYGSPAQQYNTPPGYGSPAQQYNTPPGYGPPAQQYNFPPGYVRTCQLCRKPGHIAKTCELLAQRMQGC
eukprot:TRINITY_DN644_c0_g2_i4.p1 TRINITY_DN644_c0_g2~~TRINITY_DN644_c0_g2_i4.p1  ORF type:complete len:302 (-),score=68.39 TRINITY_DN644_c0_g2_i4:75-980(-)